MRRKKEDAHDVWNEEEYRGGDVYTDVKRMKKKTRRPRIVFGMTFCRPSESYNTAREQVDHDSRARRPNEDYTATSLFICYIGTFNVHYC